MDLVGGHISFSAQTVSSTASQVRGGALVAIAHSGKERFPDFPDVPTFKEQGVDLVFASERGIVAPRGLPPDIEQKLAGALERVAVDPAFRRQMAQQFTEMDYLPGPAWRARLQQDDARLRAIWARTPWVE